jgi:hypothetical protein
MNTDDPDKPLTPSERAQLNDLANKIVRPEFDKAPPKDAFGKLIAKLDVCHKAVQRQAQPIIVAGGCVPTPTNKLAMQAHLIQWYTEAFGLALNKDEAIAAVAWVWTSTAMQSLFPEKLGKSPKI